jgi:hypothetical protein
MAIFDHWRPAHEGEERIDYRAGGAIVIYRNGGPNGPYFWRIAGSTAPAETTGTTSLVEARKIAMRGADLAWRQNIEQNAAALIMLGTGMGS